MTAAATLGPVTCLGRSAVQRWLRQLDEWLLEGAPYSVHHTWPALYRSDGHGKFFTLFDGDELVSHCATRDVTVRTSTGEVRITLLGSVATAPAHRGRGLAGRVLESALAESRQTAGHVVLWAERPELYARHGFVPGPEEHCLVLARRPHQQNAETALRVRPATIADHPRIHALHEQKPVGVVRSPHETSGLLTTPGMTTMVGERAGTVTSYACCGKGADLENHWHEVGGPDGDIAELLHGAMHACDQIDTVLLLPPYRPGLRTALGPTIVGEFGISGPMSCSHDPGAELPDCWIDGLDSV